MTTFFDSHRSLETYVANGPALWSFSGNFDSQGGNLQWKSLMSMLWSLDVFDGLEKVLVWKHVEDSTFISMIQMLWCNVLQDASTSSFVATYIDFAGSFTQAIFPLIGEYLLSLLVDDNCVVLLGCNEMMSEQKENLGTLPIAKARLGMKLRTLNRLLQTVLSDLKNVSAVLPAKPLETGNLNFSSPI